MGLRGHKRMILESEILAAQSISATGKECAKNLGVHFNTYKTYATRYGLYQNLLTKVGSPGIPRPKDPYKSTQKLNDILDNKYPNADRVSVLKKLIKSRLKLNECEVCGYHEKRITDDVIPLTLCFKDENFSNFSIDNLQVCCFNCSHNLHDMVIIKKPNHMHKSHARKKGVDSDEE